MLLYCATSFAGDWPQIHGPNRNGIAEDEKLLDAWPAKGPEIAWRTRVGSGFAGPAIVGGKVIVFHRVDDNERVEAFDLTSGKPVWKADFPATFSGGIDADKGPRCVPVVHEGNVYAFGAAGDLHCVELKGGKKLWSRSLGADYSAPEGYFGTGSTPIVAGERLWVNLGAKDAGLVALSLKTGKTIYAGTSEQASYSSPALGKFGQREYVVFVTRLNCLAIDPTSGKELFRFPHGERGPTVNAAAPLVKESFVFVTSSYNIGAKLVHIKDGKATTEWENDTSLSSQYNTPILHPGGIFGIHGREDAGLASLRSIEAMTGKVQWSEDDFGVAHLILADDKLLVVRNAGEVWLIAADAKKVKVLAKAQVAKGTIRAQPALSQGRLVIRTVASGDKGELICAAVGK